MSEKDFVFDEPSFGEKSFENYVDSVIETLNYFGRELIVGNLNMPEIESDYQGSASFLNFVGNLNKTLACHELEAVRHDLLLSLGKLDEANMKLKEFKCKSEDMYDQLAHLELEFDLVDAERKLLSKELITMKKDIVFVDGPVSNPDLVLSLGKPDEVDIEWEDFKCEFEERNDQLANLEFGLDLVDAERKEELVSVKEDIVFVDDPVSNPDLVLSFGKPDEANIKWGEFQFQFESEERNNQLANLELGLDLVDTERKEELVSVKEDTVLVDDSNSNSDLVLSLVKSDKANIEWKEFQCKSKESNDQLINFELGLDLVNAGEKKNQEDFVSMKEDIVFVDGPVSNPDLVLSLGKPDEVDIEWGEVKCEFEERNDQLANLEFGLDLVDAERKQEPVSVKEDIMFVDDPVSNSDLVLSLGKPDEVDIKWEEVKFQSKESDDQLANFELGLDLVDAERKEELVSVKEDIVFVDDPVSDPDLVFSFGKLDKAYIKWGEFKCKSKERNDQLANFELGLDLVDAGEKNQEDLVSMKENTVFVDDPVSNSDLVLSFGKLDEADIEWKELCKSEEKNDQLANLELGLDLVDAGEKNNYKELVSLKEDTVFVDDLVSNSDLLLSFGKLDEVDIEWEELKYKSKEKNDQLANLELGLDLVDAERKKELTSVKEDIMSVDDPVSNPDLVLPFEKLDKADIEWGKFQFQSEEKNDQLVNFELGLDLVDAGEKNNCDELVSMKEDIVSANDSISGPVGDSCIHIEYDNPATKISDYQKDNDEVLCNEEYLEQCSLHRKKLSYSDYPFDLHTNDSNFTIGNRYCGNRLLGYCKKSLKNHLQKISKKTNIFPLILSEKGVSTVKKRKECNNFVSRTKEILRKANKNKCRLLFVKDSLTENSDTFELDKPYPEKSFRSKGCNYNDSNITSIEFVTNELIKRELSLSSEISPISNFGKSDISYNSVYSGDTASASTLSSNW